MILRMVLALAFASVPACEGADAEPRSRPAASFRSERVDDALRSASDVMRTRGFAGEGAPWRGFSAEGMVSTDELTLRTGNCYVALAVGSEAIGALSLRLYDSGGSEVAASEGGSALRYCPPQSGTYYLALRSEGAGLFAVRSFEGPTGLNVRLDDLGPPR